MERVRRVVTRPNGDVAVTEVDVKALSDVDNPPKEVYLSSPDGRQWKLTVSDLGELKIEDTRA